MNLGDFQDRRGNLLRDAVRYGWYIIVLSIVLGAVLGVGVAAVKAPKYSSTTSVIINQIAGNPYTLDSSSDVLEMLETEAVAVTSQDTLKNVVGDLNLVVTAEKLRQQTFVAVPSNTQALKITYTTGTRTQAAEIVDGIASEYLARRQTLAEDAITRQVDSYTKQIDETEALLDDAKAHHQTSRAAGYNAAILELQSQRAQIRAQPTDPGQVLTPGSVPSAGKIKRFATFAIGGAIAGILAGLALCLWRERRRDLIRSASDLDDYAFEAPVTAIHGLELDERALRHLRMRLSSQVKNHGVVSVVGLKPRQALATSVLLGRSLAAGGTSVMLIDGTGTEYGHRDSLGFDGMPGLAQALLSKGAEPPTVFQVGKNFEYLPAGDDAEAASTHLVDDYARTVINGVAERGDITLVACMRLDYAEGEALAGLTEGLILLVQLHRTSHYELGMALKTVNRQGRRLLGVFVLPVGK